MDALLLTGFQLDFLPGGSLSIPEGNKVVDTINTCMDNFSSVILCKDWHPANHSSFAANHLWRRPGQTMTIAGEARLLWDMHCVMDSFGAELAPQLQTDKIEKTFFKGTNPDKDSYSCFFDEAGISNGLLEYLEEKKTYTLYLAGMPLEYEIYYTALDALNRGFRTSILTDACCALNEENKDTILAELHSKGAGLVKSTSIIKP